MMNKDLSTTPLDPLTTGFLVTGEVYWDDFGNSVNTAGDLNKDGYDDLIIGAFRKYNNKGAVYVVYGGEKSSMRNIDLSTTPLDPLTTGFQITGRAQNDLFGNSVSTAGDINNDGYDDILIGAYARNGNTGEAYVIYGGEKADMMNIDLGVTTLDPLTTSFYITGGYGSTSFGYSVSTVGNIDSDGSPDIIVGAYGKNSAKGAAYVIYGGSCPAYCTRCNSNDCTQCASSHFLYQEKCLDTCPMTTFASTDNSCKDCPSHCSVCASQESCQVCNQGYFLFNSLCVSSPPSAQPTQQNSYQAISSVTKGVGSVVSVGNAVFPLSSLVSKIVQNTRYLNISVTNDLAEIYQTWDTNMISWQVPNVFDNGEDHFKTSPSLFARYELDSSFLANFWPTLSTTGVGFAAFLFCYLLSNLLKRANYEGWFSSLVQKLTAGSFNFALVQAYTCLDDILFYLVLDAKTNPFNLFYAWASFICALIFLVFGCFLVLWNFWFVKKYQDIKNKGLANIKKNKKDIEDFKERNKYWELFYSDFNENDLSSQSFLAIIIIRSTLSSLITAVLYEYPILQTSFLVVLDGAIMLFLYFKSPFNALRGKLAQWFFEIITFWVHIITFILSFQDTLEKPSEKLKDILSTGIIYLNTALVTGGLGFMFIEIYETIRAKIKERRSKKRQNSINQENQEDEKLTRTESILRISGPDAQKGQMKNLNLSLEFQNQNNSNIAILGGPFQHFDSNFNAENSFGPDTGFNGQTDQSPVPIIQRKLRILKPTRSEPEVAGQAKNVKQSKNIVKISCDQEIPE